MLGKVARNEAGLMNRHCFELQFFEVGILVILGKSTGRRLPAIDPTSSSSIGQINVQVNRSNGGFSLAHQYIYLH